MALLGTVVEVSESLEGVDEPLPSIKIAQGGRWDVRSDHIVDERPALAVDLELWSLLIVAAVIPLILSGDVYLGVLVAEDDVPVKEHIPGTGAVDATRAVEGDDTIADYDWALVAFDEYPVVVPGKNDFVDKAVYAVGVEPEPMRRVVEGLYAPEDAPMDDQEF